jgi:hypothetical protein
MQSAQVNDPAPGVIETTVLAIVVTRLGEFLILLEDYSGKGFAQDTRQAVFQSLDIRGTRSPLSGETRRRRTSTRVGEFRLLLDR